MRNNTFFLAFLPIMIIAGLLSIYFADNYSGKARISGYRKYHAKSGEYSGEKISEDMGADKEEEEKYNGDILKDNGMSYAIKVNKTKNVVTVYALDDNGIYNKPIKAMVCSVGASGNTPTGKFSLGERYRWRTLFGDCYGQYAIRITGNILFHSVPYNTCDNSDLEVDEYNKLGESVSAGCVRLSVIDVKWIYDNCSEGTIVEIFESEYEGPMGKPSAAHIAVMDWRNYDPTDPDRDNPYMNDGPTIVGAFDRVIDKHNDFDITAGVSAIDKTGNDITDRIKVKGSVNANKCGDYSVTYSVEDEDGNKTSATAVFSIVDTDSPEITVDQTVYTIGVNESGSEKQLLELLLNNVAAYDDGERLPDKNIIVDYSEIFEKGLGTCHVKYMATDDEGNNSDIVEVTVDVDLEAPVLTLKDEYQSDIRKNMITDDDYMLSLVEATDNSGYVDVHISRPLSYRENEPYKVMYYAKDKVGNITTLNVSYELK